MKTRRPYRPVYYGTPTTYRGVRFRSALEASWAAWFDRLGVAWAYEAVRVRLGPDEAYTPDFAIPSGRALVEVKPTDPNHGERDRAERAAGVTGGGIYFVCGPPRYANYFEVRDAGGWATVPVVASALPFVAEYTPGGLPRGGARGASEEREMRIDTTTAGGMKTRNDEDYNFPTGVYTCRLDGVEDLPPKADDESKTPRVVFEFSVVEGPYLGKKLSTFCRKNLFAGKPGQARGGQPSHLYKTLKSMGIIDPMAGVDTEQLIGRLYTIVAKNDKGDRAWPDSILVYAGPQAAPAPAGQLVTTPPARSGPPPRRVATAPAERKWWLATTGADPVEVTEARIKELWTTAGLANDAGAAVAADGSDEWRPIVEAIPEAKGWIPF